MIISQYNIEGMTCQGCVDSISKMLNALDYISNAQVFLEDKKVVISSEHNIDVVLLTKALPSKYNISEFKYLIKNQNNQSLFPLFLILFYILIGTFFIREDSQEFIKNISNFMGLFFVIFSFFKFLDYKNFPNTFSMYDPLAKYSKTYAWVYPFIETILGIMFLLEIYIPHALIITLILLSITTYGVIKTILNKQKIQCACLGTAIKLPMTKATLIENLIMISMAIIMIINY